MLKSFPDRIDCKLSVYIAHQKAGYPYKLMTGVDISFRSYRQILQTRPAAAAALGNARSAIQVQVIMKEMNILTLDITSVIFVIAPTITILATTTQIGRASCRERV